MKHIKCILIIIPLLILIGSSLAFSDNNKLILPKGSLYYNDKYDKFLSTAVEVNKATRGKTIEQLDDPLQLTAIQNLINKGSHPNYLLADTEIEIIRGVTKDELEKASATPEMIKIAKNALYVKVLSGKSVYDNRESPKYWWVLKGLLNTEGDNKVTLPKGSLYYDGKYDNFWTSAVVLNIMTKGQPIEQQNPLQKTFTQNSINSGSDVHYLLEDAEVKIIRGPTQKEKKRASSSPEMKEVAENALYVKVLGGESVYDFSEGGNPHYCWVFKESLKTVGIEH